MDGVSKNNQETKLCGGDGRLYIKEAILCVGDYIMQGSMLVSPEGNY